MALYAYLRSLREKPARMAAAIATLVIPGAALGWWYYSFAMSLGAVSPLRPAVESSDLQVPDPQPSPAPVSDTQTTTAPVSSTDQADVNINSNSSSNTNSSQTSVEVNGQQIAVPDNGSTHQVIESENGKTTVDINVDSNTSGSSESRSSTSVKMRSSSNSDLNVKTKEVQ